VNAELLSDIVHVATRLQSAGMLHNAALRDFRAGDPIEPIKRDAASIATLTEKLAFKVGQLQASVASEVRRPRLDEYVTLGRAKPEAERLELSGMLADSEGGTHD
jgi:hypothetical protein